MFKKTLLLAIILLVACGSAYAGKPIIRVAVDATWPPMEFVGSNRQITGFSIDYMKAVGRHGGFVPKFIPVAWDGIFAGLGKGKFDAICSSVSITESRKKVMAFSVPYFTVRQALVVKKEAYVMTLRHLRGKKVGTQVSTTGTFAVKSAGGITSVTYHDIRLAMEDLLNDEIDGVVCDDPVATNFVFVNKNYKDIFKIAGLLGSEEGEKYGIAVKRGNQRLLQLINNGIKAVKAKKIDKKLQKKWLHK